MLGEATPVETNDPLGHLSITAGEEPIYYMSFGSGSSGNCSYIGDQRSGFLVDAGVDAAKVEEALAANGIAMTAVKGICITHDHGDHVRYLYTLLRNHRHMLLYCTPKVLNGLLRRHSISRRIKDYHRAIYKEFEFKIGNFVLTPFDVLHDGTDNCGFHISHGASSMAIVTDLGSISERVEHYLSAVDFLVLESNYDPIMLKLGSYPDYLKARITNGHGHLSNPQSAEFLARIYSPRLRYLFLCHLSADNNTADLALEAHRKAMAEAHPEVRIGEDDRENLWDMHLMALPRYDATRLFTLRIKPQQ
jgi:phosphoribosyl 1,2-cyclic phosphodiesterase